MYRIKITPELISEFFESGKTHNLSDFSGHMSVLDGLPHGCKFFKIQDHTKKGWLELYFLEPDETRNNKLKTKDLSPKFTFVNGEN